MEGILKRLIRFCDIRPDCTDDACKIIDYVLRKYGDEPHDKTYWYAKARDGADPTLAEMKMLWGDFAEIMGGSDE